MHQPTNQQGSLRAIAAWVAVMAALVAALTVPNDRAAASDEMHDDMYNEMYDLIEERLAAQGFADVALDRSLCDHAPVTYVEEVLLGVGLDLAQIATVVARLDGAYHGHYASAYGTTVFELKPGSSAVAERAAIDIDYPGWVHLNHVFFYDMHFRFSPYEHPVATTRALPTEAAFGSTDRPVVVLDTGYPNDVEDPTSSLAPYELDSEHSIVAVDASSPTAYHGPFIASQVASLVEGTVRLQRVRTELGELDVARHGDGTVNTAAEELFDEVALIETLEASELGDGVVVNMSFGTYGCEGSNQPAALEASLADLLDNEVKIVAAAGNDESGAEHYPAAFSRWYDDVTAVGAYDDQTETLKRACFSNFGTVDIWAPGVDVLGVIPDDSGGWVAQASGTSFAAPQIAAALAAGYDTDYAGLPFKDRVDDGDGKTSSMGSACS